MGPKEKKEARVTWTTGLTVGRHLPLTVACSHSLEKDPGALETTEEGTLERKLESEQTAVD